MHSMEPCQTNPVQPDADGKGGRDYKKKSALRTLRPRARGTVTRSLIIGGMVIALLIPLAFLTVLVDERSHLYSEAVRNISGRWGYTQVVSGPLLVVPYDRTSKEVFEYRRDKDSPPEKRIKVSNTRHYQILLPKHVAFAATMQSQIRYKSLYHHVVYSAPVILQGEFELPEDGPLRESQHTVLWDQAFFCLGVSDLKAITEIGSLSWAGNGASFAPGTGKVRLLGAGFHAKAALDPARSSYPFSLDMKLNGSGASTSPRSEKPPPSRLTGTGLPRISTARSWPRSGASARTASAPSGLSHI